MALLKSVDNVPGINYYDYRDDNYYGKYEFRLRVEIPCLKYTWWSESPEELESRISGKTKKFGNIKKADLQTVIDHKDALKQIITLQATRKKTKTLGMRIESDTAAFFSSDLTELQTIATALGPKYEYDYTQVQTAQYAGVKMFVNEPPHKYRVYFKSRRVEESFHVELKNLLDRQPGLFPSNALRQWVDRDEKQYSYGAWYFRWSSAAHFIDYDDESTLSYLALIYGDFLGKKYKLEKRPDSV